MPLPWAKSNRSQASAGSSNDHLAQASSGASLNQDPVAVQRYSQDQREPQGRPYAPGRSPSQRHSSNLSLDRSVHANETSPSSDRPSEAAHSHGKQVQDQKKSLRSKLGFGSSSRDSADNSRGVSRRTSVRRSDNGERHHNTPDEPQRLQTQQPQWSQRQGSNTNLAPSREEDESNLDPFLQQAEAQPSPPVPTKDPQYSQAQQYQQYHEQFQRPTLSRVNTNTEHGYPAQNTVDHYSPEQHGGQQQQYISYSQPGLEPNPHGQYQAFHPVSATSPHPLGPPPQYQQGNESQPQLYTPHSQHQENQQYPTDFQHQRPPSQQQQHPPEILHPQPIHTSQQQQQQQQQVQDSLNPQTFRSSSTQQLVAPPSPVVQYQAYDPQANTYQPASSSQHQQGQGNMPSSSQHRAGLRSSDMKQGGAGLLSRENSMQQSQQQGQPPTPGMQTFGTNVVPQQAQGQPYRGSDRKQGQLQDGEAGRATPPPNRSVNDMTEEDVHNLLKEHDILREKYQKVKRYFFDQQSQVHQLQNTLANQRLSLSRTSLDDSEYAARFKRLDGLISQFALSIRKNWKSIPPWLQPGVNKEAMATGGKEMIVAGRAFIAAWLVDEVFDKYFHPDLEIGLSSQLKAIQHNIRLCAPAANNSEEEEALMSKIINWRLATLEGLADQLRSQQSHVNRQRLVEILNEKLLASLELNLQEPAPAELASSVPMIIELAIGIAVHLPMESRDVLIEYYPPGQSVLPEFMSIESTPGVAALTNPISDSTSDDRSSLLSTDSRDEQDASQGGKQDDKRGRGGMFGGLMSNKKPLPGQQGRSTIGGGGSSTSLPQPPGSASGPKEEQQRVRMAAGVSVRIRHRSVLVKAPVYLAP